MSRITNALRLAKQIKKGIDTVRDIIDDVPESATTPQGDELLTREEVAGAIGAEVESPQTINTDTYTGIEFRGSDGTNVQVCVFRPESEGFPSAAKVWESLPKTYGTLSKVQKIGNAAARSQNGHLFVRHGDTVFFVKTGSSSDLADAGRSLAKLAASRL